MQWATGTAGFATRIPPRACLRARPPGAAEVRPVAGLRRSRRASDPRRGSPRWARVSIKLARGGDSLDLVQVPVDGGGDVTTREISTAQRSRALAVNDWAAAIRPPLPPSDHNADTAMPSLSL